MIIKERETPQPLLQLIALKNRYRRNIHKQIWFQMICLINYPATEEKITQKRPIECEFRLIDKETYPIGTTNRPIAQEHFFINKNSNRLQYTIDQAPQ